VSFPIDGLLIKVIGILLWVSDISPKVQLVFGAIPLINKIVEGVHPKFSYKMS
jgi:hypothetical protein